MGGPLHRTTFFVAFRHKKNARILLRQNAGVLIFGVVSAQNVFA